MPISVKTADGLKSVNKVLIKTADGLKEILSAFGKQNNTKVKLYSSSRWEKLNDFPVDIAGIAMTVYNGKIFAYGGHKAYIDDGDIIREQQYVFRFYDPVEDSWTTITDPNLVNLDSAMMTVIDDALYIVGRGVGASGTTIVKVVGDGVVNTITSVNLLGTLPARNGFLVGHSYDVGSARVRLFSFPNGNPTPKFTTVSWIDGDLQNAQIYDGTSTGSDVDRPAFTQVGDKYYLCGGEKFQPTPVQSDFLYSYVWSGSQNIGNRIPEAISQQGAANDGTNLYFFGGLHRDANGDYQYRKELWVGSSGNDPKIVRRDDSFPGPGIAVPALAVLGEYLYIVGGMVDGTSVNSVYRYRLT